MNSDTRLSSALHLLLHMAIDDRPLTSQALSNFVDSNPAVVRRTLAGLREVGWISAARGHGGGWVLSCDLARLTVADVHRALGAPLPFAVANRNTDTRCVIEQSVNAAVDQALGQAESAFIKALERISLGDLATEFKRRWAAHHGAGKAVSHE